MISIIIPIKDNLDITKVCLDSIRLYTKNYQLIIINDGSGKETTEYLESLENVLYLHNEESVGWCKAINQGLEYVIGDYIVLANNDIVVTPKWSEKFIKHFENDKSLGIIGPTTNQVDGYQHIDFNKQGVDFQYADVLTFFCVMMRNEVFRKVGNLDERFGLGGQDDADYAIRIRKAGYKVGIARDVFIYHYGSATFRNEFNNDVEISQDFAKSRIDILRDKYKDEFDTGIRKRIFIAIPNGGNIVPELASLLIKWSHDPKWELQVYMPKGLFPLSNARNHCVQKFLEGNCDYLFWIDDDIIPPINCLEKFLTADKDIIGAVAFAMKYENGCAFPYPVTLRYDSEKNYVVHYGEGIEEYDATGGACVMFKRKVYEEIECPYEFHYYRNGTLKLTCDFDIFQKAQKLGFKLFIDNSLICDHIKESSLLSIQNTMVKNG